MLTATGRRTPSGGYGQCDGVPGAGPHIDPVVANTEARNQGQSPRRFEGFLRNRFQHENDSIQTGRSVGIESGHVGKAHTFDEGIIIQWRQIELGDDHFTVGATDALTDAYPELALGHDFTHSWHAESRASARSVLTYSWVSVPTAMKS